jgi:hypothetical protein
MALPTDRLAARRDKRRHYQFDVKVTLAIICESIIYIKVSWLHVSVLFLARVTLAINTNRSNFGSTIPMIDLLRPDLFFLVNLFNGSFSRPSCGWGWPSGSSPQSW